MYYMAATPAIPQQSAQSSAQSSDPPTLPKQPRAKRGSVAAQKARKATLARAHEVAAYPSHLGRPRSLPLKNQLDSDKLPWEFQPFDSPRSFHAFEVYLALGVGRSLQKTELTLRKHSRLSSKEVSINDTNKCFGFTDNKLASIISAEPLSALIEWCQDNLWVMRSRCWDAHLMELRIKAQEDEIVYMNKAQAKRFAKIQELAESRFEDIKDLPKITRWRDVPILLQMLSEGAKGERVARGLAAEANPAVTINQDFNLAALSSSELDSFVALHAKVLSGPSLTPTSIEPPKPPSLPTLSQDLELYSSIDPEDIIEVED